MCKCGLEAEATLQFFLCCGLYSTDRKELLGDIYAVPLSFTNYPDENFLNILLYESEHFGVLTSVQTNQFKVYNQTFEKF